MVKRENETLRRRIRELERSLSYRRQSDLDRSRNDLAATNILNNSGVQGHAAGANTEEDDDMVNVGESAGSIGVGGGF